MFLLHYIDNLIQQAKENQHFSLIYIVEQSHYILWSDFLNG